MVAVGSESGAPGDCRVSHGTAKRAFARAGPGRSHRDAGFDQDGEGRIGISFGAAHAPTQSDPHPGADQHAAAAYRYTHPTCEHPDQSATYRYLGATYGDRRAAHRHTGTTGDVQPYADRLLFTTRQPDPDGRHARDADSIYHAYGVTYRRDNRDTDSYRHRKPYLHAVPDFAGFHAHRWSHPYTGGAYGHACGAFDRRDATCR